MPILRCQVADADVELSFPPSLSEGTDGQGIFGDWAWWTGERLHVSVTFETDEADDVEDLRVIAIDTAEEALRRFLNAVRSRFERHDVHPVRVDPKELALFEEAEDGTRRALPEPFDAFFYKNMPDEPPLATSINSTTLDELRRDIELPREPALALQLELDARALEEQGEHLRAELVRMLARQQM